MKKLINASAYRLSAFSFQDYATDFYYTKLARQIYDIMWFHGYGKDCGEMICYETSLALAHYMEDIVADFGLWRTFVEKHHALYGRYLPFYDDPDNADYYPDEPHLQDVQFIIWMYAQQLRNNNSLINPENPYLAEMAGQVYQLIDREFEQAPINEEITSALEKMCNTNDVFDIKFTLKKMGDSYLLAPFQDDMYISTSEYLKAYEKEVDSNQFDYAVSSINLFTKKHGPLNLYMTEWLSALLAHHGYEEQSKCVAAIEGRGICAYHITGYDEHHLQLESVTGEQISLDRTSFDHLPDEHLRTHPYLTASVVRYRGEWNVNGLNTFCPTDMVYKQMKKADEQRKADAKAARTLLEANHGYPLAYFADVPSMTQWLNTNLGISTPHTDTSAIGNARGPVALYMSEGGINVLPNGAICIKDERNPYYDSARSAADGLGFIMAEEAMPASLAHFLIEHRMLPDVRINSTYGTERGTLLIQANFDFWLRFMRTDNY